MVEFDIESDFRFQGSLKDLGGDGELDVLEAIDDILEKQLSWVEFVRWHGWQEVRLVGEQTYPGAIELFAFIIKGDSGKYYELVASAINTTVVVCAIARRFTPLP